MTQQQQGTGCINQFFPVLLKSFPIPRKVNWIVSLRIDGKNPTTSNQL